MNPYHRGRFDWWRSRPFPLSGVNLGRERSPRLSQPRQGIPIVAGGDVFFNITPAADKKLWIAPIEKGKRTVRAVFQDVGPKKRCGMIALAFLASAGLFALILVLGEVNTKRMISVYGTKKGPVQADPKYP